MTHKHLQSTEQMIKPPPAVVIGNFKVMHRSGQAFEEVKGRLAQQGLQLQQTAHFLLAYPSDNSHTTVVHQLAPEDINNNIVDFLMQELQPLEIISSDQAFSHLLIGIVTSVQPRNPLAAWDLFTTNTLQRLREQLHKPSIPADDRSSIAAFASIYRRLFSLKVGHSLLDVGCACAFWPILLAEQEPTTWGRIVGIDSRRDAINLSTNLAKLNGITNLEFLQIDLLTPQFLELGVFDTITAIHLLEHLPQVQLPQAFEHLLQVTGQRLIIAVPYEEQPTAAYGHEHTFTPETLEYWGKYCVKALNGKAHYWLEEAAGGLLIIDRIKGKT